MGVSETRQMSSMNPNPNASSSKEDGKANSLSLCEHCDLLGVSSVIRADREVPDIIYCALCRRRFHFLTEGNKLIVTAVEPFEEVDLEHEKI
jgi:hypothetical protein